MTSRKIFETPHNKFKKIAKMPPKIYYSDAQKLQDKAKSTSPAKNSKANKPSKAVVKTASVKKVAVGRKQVVERKTTNAKTPTKGAKSVQNSSPKPASNSKKATTATKPASNNAGSTPLERAIQTARSIVSNPKHVKHSDVKTLLDSYQKGWITESKFIDILKSLLFA